MNAVCPPDVEIVVLHLLSWNARLGHTLAVIGNKPGNIAIPREERCRNLLIAVQAGKITERLVLIGSGCELGPGVYDERRPVTWADQDLGRKKLRREPGVIEPSLAGIWSEGASLADQSVPGIKTIVIQGEDPHGNAYLPQIAHAFDPARLFFCLTQGGKKKRRQKSDN